ncbi:C6 zinc finger domain protein [Colletotrichum higginsianum IMI 349063]|uniref:C6 zinc finger domain protein n=3 Tax=Colletotrichum destructivum species complex TaxID=2707350 RepID=A0A1B7XSI8_COLHI|nr:C6 zinc finger domain protein [Colletotrichum higginsianum IMI 349063]OBR02694.1 C6 zinc finger domain protein [Colletotrichum higginsianum IMI 349063]
MVRKQKSSSYLAKRTPKSRQPSLDDNVAPPSPTFSNSFELDPTLLFDESNQELGSTIDMNMSQEQGGLLSPSMNLVSEQLGTSSKDNNNSLQYAKEEQNQIDQWLAICSLLSPNGTTEMINMKGGEFSGPWQELGKDTSYCDLIEDSGDDGLSSEETQLDFDMNEGTDIVDESSSTPGLSSPSLDMLLDENFAAHHPVGPQVDHPTASKAQPSRKGTPVAYKMSAPAATSPMSALLESVDTTRKKKTECRCLRLAAHLLEQLGNEGANTEVPTMDGLLNCCREAIKGCESILGCTLCKSRSESMMLLAMAGQYLSSICEKTVRCYVDVAQQAQSPTTPFAGGAAIWFQSYKVESSSVQIQVLRFLVTGQLTEFCQLIGKIKSRVGTRKAHLAPLLGAERRIQCMRTLLMKCDRGDAETL